MGIPLLQFLRQRAFVCGYGFLRHDPRGAAASVNVLNDLFFRLVQTVYTFSVAERAQIYYNNIS